MHRRLLRYRIPLPLLDFYCTLTVDRKYINTALKVDFDLDNTPKPSPLSDQMIYSSCLSSTGLVTNPSFQLKIIDMI